MSLRSIRVERRHIGYVRWLLESHDGIATPTTREGADDVLDLLVAPDFILDFEDLLSALADELGAVVVPSPETPPLGG